ncbi:MAG: hypothetical protein HYY06_07480 [Deltaproteobacteria bacterium]|nr:hypothetical protein [Deltaproteobacteria bacterium]
MRPSQSSSRTAIAVAVAAAAAAFAESAVATAEPRFAARYGAPCTLCHVNPSGGGMRTAFGRNVFEARELGWWAFAPIDPQLGEQLALGGDFRLAVIGQPDRSTEPLPASTLLIATPTELTAFPMQADLYLAATPIPAVTFYSDVGAGGSYEVFGMLQAPVAGLYLKAGFFVPPYGTRLPNHTAAIRQPIGFDPRAKDAGLEAGMIFGPLSLQAAVVNGEQGGSPMDMVEGLALSTRAELRLGLGPLRLTLGGSYYRAHGELPARAPDEEPDETVEWRAGPFLWANLGRLTYVGEAALRRLEDGGQLVAYHELTFLMARGLEIGGTWEYMDRDVDLAVEPADVLHRAGLSLQVFPLPMTEVHVLYRRYLARSGQPEDGQHEILAFLHLFL